MIESTAFANGQISKRGGANQGGEDCARTFTEEPAKSNFPRSRTPLSGIMGTRRALME